MSDFDDDTVLDEALELWGPTADPALEGLFTPDTRPTLLTLCDSWGAIPPPWLVAGPPANLLGWLEKWGKWRLVRLTENGGELAAFLSGARKLKLCKMLDTTRFDAMLLSGGGNGLLGAYDLPGMVRTRASAAAERLLMGEPTAKYGCFTPMFFRTLGIKKAAVLNLLDWVARSKRNSDLLLFHHTYDFPSPSDQGATFLGGALKFQGGRSWIKPYFQAAGWTDPAEQLALIRAMLLEFKAMLEEIEEEVHGYRVIDTQGTLSPEDWRDEIHPTSSGFERIARKIEAALSWVEEGV
jgi:lysophospholipase L1-like esterase